MIKKLVSAALFLIGALTVSAQTPLPLNPEVRHGQLSNGLNYYILHNEEPKGKVNFYIAQKVGSTLETPDQLGLAHFLEHMAFNGTKNYPGKSMLNYLQSKGIRFGADINAYTGFDETVYNIDNIPSSDQALVDSVLLVIHDWSGSILLEESEINAERGVIEEEWRSRNDADHRMYLSILPKLYEEYQYHQMPIGSMDVVRNFKPEVLRAYYKKWYRPDQQGVVIVGDINVDEMEQKVKTLFSDIPMPENAAERVYASVSDNEKPIYAYFKDKELQYPSIRVMFKSDVTPREMRNTVEGFMMDDLLENLISTMINNRLNDYQKTPECKYAYAGVYFGSYFVSSTKNSFGIFVIPKDDITESYDDALRIVMQALKTGFMESELVRARDEMIANYEKLYNERDKTKTEGLANELIRHFIDNDPAPGIAVKYELVKQILPTLPVQAINQICPQLLTPNNQVIVLCQPEKEGMEIVTEDEMVGGLQKAMAADYEPFVDEVITEPLISKLPTPGKILSTKEGAYGSTEFTLSNGVRVVVKPTDFKADEILLDAVRLGGKDTYSLSDANEVQLLDDAYQLSQIGPFSSTRLQKYLAGKKVGTSLSVGNTRTTFSGVSTVKDFPTLMELIYASFTDLSGDEATYKAQIEQAKTLMKNQENNPEYQFYQVHVPKASFPNNPMLWYPDYNVLDKANYAREVELLKENFSNAADYTFYIVGNVNMDTLKPLLEQYIATLPSAGNATVAKPVNNITVVPGQVEDKFDFTMQVPSVMVYNKYTDTNIPYDTKNSVMVEMVGDILEIIYTNTLREEEGGTYSPYAGAGFNPYTGEWQILYLFQTNGEQKDKLEKMAYDNMMNLLNNGADEADFQKVRGAMLNQYSNTERTNGYWKGQLLLRDSGFDDASEYRQVLENMTLADLNAFMKTLYNGKNRVQVVLNGVAAE